MPAFYPRSQGSTQPLTPPDSGSGYGYSDMHYPQQQYLPNLGSTRHDGAYDYQHNYMQPAVAPAPPNYQYQAGSFQQANNLPPISSYYEPIGAPILPPLRIAENMGFTDDYQRRIQQQEQQSAVLREQQRQAAKEEKASGGVSAKLDYDMERMTDFVAQMTQKIFAQTVTSQPSFRKWVNSVLSATRLPSATILLSLYYLAERFKLHPESIQAGENQIYRLLAVSLILGSKFLDDNTFVNKSWSDVTSIRVGELNMLEMKWLQLINYDLHIDPQGGVQEWMQGWQKYDANETAKQHVATRLSPLDTNIHRHTARDRFSPYPSPYSSAASQRYDTPHSTRSSQYSTPYTSADPWASTSRATGDYDTYYNTKRPMQMPTLNDYDNASRRASEERQQQMHQQHQQQQYAAYLQTAPAHSAYNSGSHYQPTPSYPSAWDAYAWNGGAHRTDCTCTSCAYQHHYRPYPLASSYSAQTVMG